MRALSFLVAFVALWFAGCSTNLGTVDQSGETLNPFGKYDREFIAAVQNRWYDLSGGSSHNDYRAGKVVLAFKLHANGRITEIEVKTSTVSKKHEKLCRQALLDPAPYKPWPKEMRLMVGEDYRNLTFSFVYK